MLFKYENITIAVMHKGKDAFYTCTVYDGTKLLESCKVDMDAWDSDENELRSFLYRNGMTE